MTYRDKNATCMAKCLFRGGMHCSLNKHEYDIQGNCKDFVKVTEDKERVIIERYKDRIRAEVEKENSKAEKKAENSIKEKMMFEYGIGTYDKKKMTDNELKKTLIELKTIRGYNNKRIASYFNVASNTVRVWCKKLSVSEPEDPEARYIIATYCGGMPEKIMYLRTQKELKKAYIESNSRQSCVRVFIDGKKLYTYDAENRLLTAKERARMQVYD